MSTLTRKRLAGAPVSPRSDEGPRRGPLPAGWIRTSLGAITEERISQAGPPHRRDFVYVDIGSVDNKTKRIVDPKTLPADGAPSRARQNLLANDVVVSMTRPNLNAVAMVPPELEAAVGSTGFHVLRAKGVSPGWLYYAVQTTDFVEAMCRVVQGALYPAVRPRDIRAYEAPLPPLPEQRRIVAEVEKQFTRLDAGVAALKRVQANLGRCRAAVLKAACEGSLPSIGHKSSQAPRCEVHWARLDEVCSVVTDGDHLPPPKTPGGVPFLTIGNISGGRLDFSETRFVPESYFRRIKPDRVPRRGDVLYTVVGATIGIPVLVDVDRPFCFQRHIALLRPSDKILPRFLWACMADPGTHREAWKRTTGSAQPTLPLSGLRSLSVPVPPVAEQRRIVEEVERRLSVLSELDATVSVELQRVARLRQSVLQKAFRGES